MHRVILGSLSNLVGKISRRIANQNREISIDQFNDKSSIKTSLSQETTHIPEEFIGLVAHYPLEVQNVVIALVNGVSTEVLLEKALVRSNIVEEGNKIYQELMKQAIGVSNDSEEIETGIFQFRRDIAQAVASIRLKDIMGIVNTLHPRERRVVLNQFGYFMPSKTSRHFAEENGMNWKTYYSDLNRAKQRILDLVDARDIPTWDLSIRALVNSVENAIVWRSKYGIYDYSSPRIKLIELPLVHDIAFRAKLTDNELELLELAMMHNDGEFVYSDLDIAEILGYEDMNSIRVVYYNLLKFGDAERFIGTDNRVIKKISYQYKFIKWLTDPNSDLTRLDFLDEVQKRVFQLLVTPNGELRRYLSLDQVKDILGDYPGFEFISHGHESNFQRYLRGIYNLLVQ